MTTHQFPLRCSETCTHTWRLEIEHLVPYCSWSQNAPSKCNGKTPDLRRMERRRRPQGCSAPGGGFVVEGTVAQLSIQLLSHVLNYQWLCPWWKGSFPEDFPGWGEYWFFCVKWFFSCLFSTSRPLWWLSQQWKVVKKGLPCSGYFLWVLSRGLISQRLSYSRWPGYFLGCDQSELVFLFQGAIMRNGLGRNEHYHWPIHQSCCWSEAEPFYSESPKPAATWRRWEAQELVKGTGKGKGIGTSKECKWDKRDKEQVWHG